MSAFKTDMIANKRTGGAATIKKLLQAGAFTNK
jgi:hypothetical protein